MYYPLAGISNALAALASRAGTTVDFTNRIRTLCDLDLQLRVAQGFANTNKHRVTRLNRFDVAMRIAHEFEDEKGHASKLIERILFLEGLPNLAQREALRVGSDVAAMLSNDLKVEYAVDALLKEAIVLCEAEQDYVSREMLETLLVDTEEDHAFWLEQQLGLIDKIGVHNYIQSQM